MGFLANLAAKSEMKTRDQVLACFDDLSADLDMKVETGNVLLPCHIISEAHNGFYVNYEEHSIGIFRCQNHWWLYELSEDSIRGLRSPDSQSWMKKLELTNPINVGEIHVGIPALVSSILYMFKTLEETANNEIKAERAEAQKLDASRLKARDDITNRVNNAASLLWDSGCEMRVFPFQPEDPNFPDSTIVFRLMFVRYRGDWPLYLYADLSNNCWFLSDAHIPEAGTVSVAPIDSSSKTTAMNILQLIVQHGFSNAHLSFTQTSWVDYIDVQFLPRMTSGIIPELLRDSSASLKSDVQKALNSMIRAYEEYPIRDYSLAALKELREI